MSSTTGLFYHEYMPVTVRLAQAVGITASAFLCGHTAAASYLLTPAVMEAPAPILARQWSKVKRILDDGGSALSIVCGVTFGALAYREPTSTSAFKLYAAAAVLVPSLVAYDLVAMNAIDREITEKCSSAASEAAGEAAAAADKGDNLHGLIDRWATMNLGKAVLAGVGALCGAWAVIDKVDVVNFERLGLASGANRLG